jgi:glycosyltransferase involved in cell wall biosynthesis
LVSSNKGILVKDALGIPGVKTVFLSSLKRPINPLADLVTLFKLTSLLKKEDITLVHTHSSKAGILGRWAARLAGVPVIIHTIHGWSFHNHLNFPSKALYAFLERITAKFTNKLIAVSRSDIQKGLRNRIGTKDKYALIRYGIAKGNFINCNIDISSKKKELGLEANSALVGMVVCFKPQKAPQDFVRAASLIIKRNPKTKFILVGEGILRGKIEWLIDNLKLKENFVLTGCRRDIPEIMSCLDVLVLSSLWEGSPIVLLEAMCRSLPIVAYDVDGVCEVVKDGVNGFLVAPGDVAGLAHRINNLLEDKELLKKMGMHSFNLVTDNGYHVQRMLKDLDKLYFDLACETKLRETT